MLSSLRGCSSTGRVKIWSKLEGEESQEMLFNDAKEMAKVLIVGIPFSRASLRVTGGHIKVQITVLSPRSWTELWERAIDGAVFCHSSELLKTLFHDLPDEEPHASGHEHGHEQRGNFQQAAMGSSSSSSFDEAMVNPPSNTSPIDTFKGSTLTSQEVQERPLQQAERSALEITIFVGSEAGVGVEESELRLARKAENCCALSGILKLEFSMIKQPPILSMHDERVMDVEVSSTYELPCGSIVEDEGLDLEEQGQVGVQGHEGQLGVQGHEGQLGVQGSDLEAQGHEGAELSMQPRNDVAENQAKRDDGGPLRWIRVGILHDMLAANFKCTSSPEASSLWSSEKVGVTSMDMTEKSTSSISRENEIGLNVGGIAGHPGSTFQIMGSVKHARSSAKGKEYGVASKVDAVCGTDFILVDRCQRRQSSFDVLGYEAIHKPSLGLLSSLEEGGLSKCVGEPVVSALGRTATVQFRGRFLLDGVRMEKHELCLSRRLAEMNVKMKKRHWIKRLKKSKEKEYHEVVLGKQITCFAFMINHAFSLDLYQGAKLVWKLRRARASPIPRIIDVVPQQPVVPQQQVVLQQHAIPQQQQQVVPAAGGPTGGPAIADGPEAASSPQRASSSIVDAPTTSGPAAATGSPPRASSAAAGGAAATTTSGPAAATGSPPRASSSAATNGLARASSPAAAGGLAVN